MTNTPRLPDARGRGRELERAATEVFDLLVVGGGITGVGVALDAASRGLRVVLVEAEDLAHGTSRWSSKLVHGGLRYLATGDFATAHESAQERHNLMTAIAPHLIRPLPQLIPFGAAASVRQRLGGAAGMALGDLLRLGARTPRRTLPGPRFVTAKTVRALAPAVSPHRLRGGMLGADGQLVDDARLVIAVARTAVSHGATVLTRVRATALRRDGASVVDTLSGESFDVSARAVVNASGVWAGSMDPGIRVRPSRGTHLIVDAAKLGSPRVAVMVPHRGSISRFVFALPQQFGRVLIGLTDEDAPGPIPEVPEPTEAEISFLLDTFNRALQMPLCRADVIGAFAGLRPLIDAEGAVSSADVSRKHLVTVSDAGFINVLGGKLTTYRRMAEDAVDLARETFSLRAGSSVTAALPLVGARPRSGGDTTSAPEPTQRRYGHEAGALIEHARVSAPREPIAPGIDVLRAEVEFAVRAEGALTVDDVLDRRTRIGLVPADRVRALEAVTDIVTETLTTLDG